MALLEKLEADPALYSGQQDRIVYTGVVEGRRAQVAVAQDGSARLRLNTEAEHALRFGTRAQLPVTALSTGDTEFDTTIGMLGHPTAVLRVGAEARRRIMAWLAEPGRWCTDTEVGARDVAPGDLDRVSAEGLAVLASLEAPELPELIEMHRAASEPVARLIAQRLLARLPEARQVAPVLRALLPCAPEDRVRWLDALGDRIADHPTEVLRALPDPAPVQFDRWCLRWAATHADAAARLRVIAQDVDRRRALLRGLSNDAVGLRALFAQMPEDAAAVADIEAVTPATAAARLARVEALASRPAGDPRAWRLDVRVSDAATRTAVSQAVQRLLPQWLADPRTAALALEELGLAASNGALLIDMVERDGAPALVALLTRTAFPQVRLEQRRLEVLSRAEQVPPFDLSEVRAALDPALRAAADGVLTAHLSRWLADPSAARALRDVGAMDAALKDEVIAQCQARPCPGAVRLLASMQPRAEKARVALAQALGMTGSPEAESPLLKMMGSGYAVRLACIEGLARVGGKAGLRALEGIASGFFVEKALKETALRSIAQIESRLGGGAGALSMATADGRLSLSEGGGLTLGDD